MNRFSTRLSTTSVLLMACSIGFYAITLNAFEIAPSESPVPTARQTNCLFSRSLSVGITAPEVACLQKYLNESGFSVSATGAGSPGSESTYFGSKTKATVTRWQAFQGLPATGFFGPLSRAAYLKTLATIVPPPAPVSSPSPRPPLSPSPRPSPAVIVNPLPIIESVSPARVSEGDSVLIRGQNFTSTGNTVTLAYGDISRVFTNLPSSDARTITFVYQPPEVSVTEQNLYALPPQFLDKIKKPVEAAGGSLDDLVHPYRGIKSKTELDEFLKKNNSSIDNLYDNFFVTVENKNGTAMTPQAALFGMRKLDFSSVSGEPQSWVTRVGLFVKDVFTFAPKKVSAVAGGGYNTGVIMYCTCGIGYLTFMTDYAGTGQCTNIYHISPGFVPRTGNPAIAGQFLGHCQQSGGQCSIYAGVTCVSITANTPVNDWGGEGI